MKPEEALKRILKTLDHGGSGTRSTVRMYAIQGLCETDSFMSEEQLEAKYQEWRAENESQSVI